MGKMLRMRIVSAILAGVIAGALVACAQPLDHAEHLTQTDPDEEAAGVVGSADSGRTLIYGSKDYTRINPVIDEHGEINILLFNGLTAHNGANEIVPGLAESWDFDPERCTYTFHLAPGVKWHDGKPFTAEDVRFTIQAIMDPANASENAPNFEDVLAITVVDALTVVFELAAPNVAFLDYMAMPIVPQHLLAGKDLQTTDFFRHPVGTGPYMLESWDEGQAIILARNPDYFKGTAKIERIIFKIVPDDNVRAIQLLSGELNLALLTPKDAEVFSDKAGFTTYRMQTSDYRGILFNFRNAYWLKNRDIIPAICYGIDRASIVDAILLGHGAVAYGPLQRNVYDYAGAEHYDYNPEKAGNVLEAAGCRKGADGYYYRNGEQIAFTICVGAGDQVRIDIAQAVAQQLRQVGIRVNVEIPAKVDWSGQMAYLIGWGSPFDADDHTYKVFGTDKGANFSGYSNAEVDRYLTEARQSANPIVRKDAYAGFQKALADDPPYAFICYIDADYVATTSVRGISSDTAMGHHGVGIFWNVTEWTIDA